MLIPMSIIMNKLKGINSNVYSDIVPQDTTFPYIVTEVSENGASSNLVITVWDHEPVAAGKNQANLVIDKLKDLVYNCCDSYFRLRLQSEATLPSEANPRVKGRKMVFKEASYLI